MMKLRECLLHVAGRRHQPCSRELSDKLLGRWIVQVVDGAFSIDPRPQASREMPDGALGSFARRAGQTAGMQPRGVRRKPHTIRRPEALDERLPLWSAVAKQQRLKQRVREKESEIERRVAEVAGLEIDE